MRVLLTLMALLCLGPAWGSTQDWLVVNGASYHFKPVWPDHPDVDAWNEANYGLGYERIWIDRSVTTLSVGALRDSNGNTTVYAGLGLFAQVGAGIDLGLSMTMLHRPRYVMDHASHEWTTEQALLFAPLPALRYSTDTWGVNLTYLPDAGTSDALFMQLRFSLD